MAAALLGSATQPAQASSHREAPFIAGAPKLDGTDFYLFRSYEAGRSGFVTMIANYLPLQDAYGGPNYFSLDPDGLYEIHLDNNGDAKEDITFQFRFKNTLKDIALPISGKNVSIPLIQAGGLSGVNPIGDKTFGGPTGYAQYAAQHVHRVNIPGCGEGKIFVGQRKDPFAVPLGKVFDLINLNPLGPPNGEGDKLADKNVTSLIVEVPIACVTQGAEPVVGGWTTASMRQARLLNGSPKSGHGTSATSGGAWTQVSRLGMPLVNEVVIGLKDKDKFNASKPADDGQFADYVTNPTLPALIETLFPIAKAPTKFPRQDLVVAFLTGVPGLNRPANVKASEMLRLNTAIAPAAKGAQNNLGVIAGDNAGFPNGRRPGDDVVDIELRVAMGVLCTLNNAPVFGCVAADAPVGSAPITDGAIVDDSRFDAAFPYLRTPLPGSPN
ncbi:MAG: DUF4331 domain-containing protein [Burkholderiaceae bacterium]|nr:DUF4331 domain-containing protein [Burkholderiaceae bacterium]